MCVEDENMKNGAAAEMEDQHIQKEAGDINANDDSDKQNSKKVPRLTDLAYELALRSVIDKMEKTKRRQEDRIHNLRNRVFLFINGYFVFQGIIFSSAFSESSSTGKCRLRMLPFVLSILVSLSNGYPLYDTMCALDSYSNELDRIGLKLEDWKKWQVIFKQTKERRPDYAQAAQPDANRKIMRRWVYGAVLCLLLAFCVAMAVACIPSPC